MEVLHNAGVRKLNFEGRTSPGLPASLTHAVLPMEKGNNISRRAGSMDLYK